MLDTGNLKKHTLVKTSFRIPKSAQRGQGMTEYIIIVALIAVAAIGAFTYFGQTIRSQTAGIANEVAGKSATDQITAAGKAAERATEQANKAKGLSGYNDNAAQVGGK
jgi:Flp pilus assembly pilin Flp